MDICVVGLGKIGLPLAAQAASRGYRVRGVDSDAAVVDAVSDALAPFPGEAGLDDLLRQVVGAGALTATTDTADAVAASTAVIVVVPLGVDASQRPDYTAIDAATDAVAAALSPGTLVVYETTLPVGTTRGRLTPRLAAGGLTPGRDLFVAHSPERVLSGRVLADLRRYPKLVGAIDDASAARAVALYEAILEFDERSDLPQPNGVWDLGSAEAAELAKLAETTFRDINIAYANELAVIAERVGVDVHAVIAACNSQPYSSIHRPGVAVGGHCIPVYPHLLLAGAPDAQLPAIARRVNDAMPAHAVGLLAELAGDLAGRRVAVLGAAYRGGVKETALSGVFPLVAELARLGALPLVHDPLFSDDELRALGLDPYHLGEPCEAAIVHTDHREYATLTPEDLPGVGAVVDGRGVLDVTQWGGVAVRRVGVST